VCQADSFSPVGLPPGLMRHWSRRVSCQGYFPTGIIDAKVLAIHLVAMTAPYISPIEMMEYVEANAFANFSSAVTKSTSRASASAM
jgi:hypothetical protein